jgi:phage-related protein
MKKAYCVLTEEYFVGYVFSETTGKAKSFALNSRLETDGCTFPFGTLFKTLCLNSLIISSVISSVLGNNLI